MVAKRKVLGLILLISVISWLDVEAQKSTLSVRGIVFHDKNLNGIKDRGERGVKGVGVSNGKQVVLTDKKGNYCIEAVDGNWIFPIMPSDYAPVAKGTNGRPPLSATRVNASQGIKNYNVNFPLVVVPHKNKFTVGVIGDLQVGNSSEINYANNSVISELQQQEQIDFSIFLGDLVNENPSIFKEVKQMVGGLPFPSYMVYGNHDRDLDTAILTQDATFQKYFGPTVYAFNRNNVHFIVLDNVYVKGKRGYEGRIPQEQITFLANDLKLVPSDQLVVICQHIPMVFTKNKKQVLSLLKDRKNCLVLSGHMHQIGRTFMGGDTTTMVHELVAGSTCGNWWVGEKDWQGIPSALMQCGSPRGYFLFEFDNNNHYQMRYKGVGLDSHKQMNIWIKGLDSLDYKVPEFDTLRSNQVFVNIFAGSDSTAVEMQIDEGKVQPMNKISMVPPAISRLRWLNKQRIYPTKYSRRAALRKRKSYHLWKGVMPCDVKKGIHRITIIARDQYGLKVRGVRVFEKK